MLIVIDLNLIILKICLFKPGRRCLKNTGDIVSNSQATNKNINIKIGALNNIKIRSNIRFIFKSLPF